MKTPTIKVTSNYDLFKTMLFNRPVLMPYVETLKTSILNRDLTMFNPIIVNEKMEVIDGQHRLEALKQAKLPVHYIVAGGTDIKDVVMLNSVNQNWHLSDYLNSFIKQGYKDYKVLKEFAAKNNLSISNAVALLSIERERVDKTRLLAPYTDFKQGKFKVTSLADGQEIASVINSLSRFCDDVAYKDREFINAVYKIWRAGEIELNELVDKVKGYRQPLYRRASSRDYLRQFEDVYNAGLSKSKVRFY